MKKFIILSLLVFIAIIILCLVQKDYWHLNDTTQNILIGLLTSSSVVFFFEVLTYVKAESRFAYVKNNFKRIDIFNKLEQRKGGMLTNKLRLNILETGDLLELPTMKKAQ